MSLCTVHGGWSQAQLAAFGVTLPLICRVGVLQEGPQDMVGPRARPWPWAQHVHSPPTAVFIGDLRSCFSCSQPGPCGSRQRPPQGKPQGRGPGAAGAQS